MFNNGRWIWLNKDGTPDSYVEFFDIFEYNGGSATLRISADSDYTAFINGKYAASGQYGDFEHYKIYDSIDLTDKLSVGENELKIVVYYCGRDTSRYRRAAAGLIFEVCEGERVILLSSEKTLSRLSPTYRSGECVFVSVQLGFTFSYDKRGEAVTGGFVPSVAIEKSCRFFPRPIEKPILEKAREPKSVTRLGGNHYLIDLGGEFVGYPTVSLRSPSEQRIRVGWGEHLRGGGVVTEIGGRHFYFDYYATEGECEFTERYLRIGARYIELFAEEDIELRYATVIPEVYPAKRSEVALSGSCDERIYEVCLRTLERCMMEHYVDCPWREQALYAADSRYQMLSGYFAFEGGNREYARANLKLIGMDTRDDGLLSICYPSGNGKAIPSFSLHYILAMEEYILHTGDRTLAEELYPKMLSVLEPFIGRIKDGLPVRFTDEKIWNFYDWSEYASGNLGSPDTAAPEAALALLLMLALRALGRIAEGIGREFPYSGIADGMREPVRRAFLDGSGLVSALSGEEQYTVLVNSLAILADVLTEDEEKRVCEAIVRGEIHDCSLSMKLFKYSALLKVDGGYREFILKEIRETYLGMLESGSDTVWETAKGASDFGGAGSLCHGWSAIPIYFYHLFGIAKRA